LRTRLFEFVWLPTFEQTSKKLLTDDDKREIEAALCEDLGAGALIRRAGGFRKLRYALKGRGNSGGARVIYLPDEERGRVYMVLAYQKGRKETITRGEEKELRRISVELKNEEC